MAFIFINQSIQQLNYPNLANNISTIPILNSNMMYVADIERIYVPIICLLGIVGNILAAVTFLNKQLRSAPCSLLLAVRCLNDSAFLLCLVFSRIPAVFSLDTSHIEGMCNRLIYVNYIAGIMTVWLTICTTFINYTLISDPCTSKSKSSYKMSVLFITLLALVAIAVYSMSLFAPEGCHHHPNRMVLTHALVYSDMLITFVIPCVIIIYLLTLIAMKASSIVANQRRRRSRSSSLSISLTQVLKVRSSPAVKIKRMLFVYSVSLLVTNFPGHLLRLVLSIQSMISDSLHISATLATIQFVTQMLYYLGFAINFPIFLTCCSRFRYELGGKFCTKEKMYGSKSESQIFSRRSTLTGFLNEVEMLDLPDLRHERANTR